MKKILLLCVLVIFSCSGGDDSSDNDDNSNQTFLERYDGVVWESTDTSEIQYKRINNDTTNIWTEYWSDWNEDGIYECYDLQDAIAISGMEITITTNIGNNFFYSYVYPEGDGGDAFITAEENGNVLEYETFYYSNYANQELHIIRNGTRVRSSFEIPCN